MQNTNKQAGFSLIELLIVVAIIGIIAAIAIPNLIASRRAANESSAISSVRTIGSAQATFSSTNAGGGYATMAQLQGANLVDARLAGAKTEAKSGYFLDTNPVASTNNSQYVTGASPSSDSSGRRWFSSGEDGVIYAKGTGTVGTSGIPTTSSNSGGSPIGN